MITYHFSTSVHCGVCGNWCQELPATGSIYLVIGIAHLNRLLQEIRSINSGCIYSKTCVKQPLSKIMKIGFQDQLWLNAGQKYCRMLQGEHSAIVLTFIKLPFVIKIFVLSIFEWPFYTGFTVHCLMKNIQGFSYFFMLEPRAFWELNLGKKHLNHQKLGKLIQSYLLIEQGWKILKISTHPTSPYVLVNSIINIGNSQFDSKFLLSYSIISWKYLGSIPIYLYKESVTVAKICFFLIFIESFSLKSPYVCK